MATPPPAYSEDDDVAAPPSYSECVEQQPPQLTIIDELSVDDEAVTAIQLGDINTVQLLSVSVINSSIVFLGLVHDTFELTCDIYIYPQLFLVQIVMNRKELKICKFPKK